MTLESDLIRRYQGAFTPQDCEECIKYIDDFDSKNLLTYDTEKLNEVDNKTINLTHSYNLASYSYLADLILPKFKPCIDEYIEAVSILRDYKFLTYDIKIKKSLLIAVDDELSIDDLKKTDKLLKIILFAAIFELMFKHNNPKKVIISEYLLASEFFLEKVQIGYLNAILDKISKVLRKDE